MRKSMKKVPTFDGLEAKIALNGSVVVAAVVTTQTDSNQVDLDDTIGDGVNQDGEGLDQLPLPVEPIDPFA